MPCRSKTFRRLVITADCSTLGRTNSAKVLLLPRALAEQHETKLYQPKKLGCGKSLIEKVSRAPAVPLEHA